MVGRFYALMDENPEFDAIRRLHPANLADSRQKLFMFLSGWLGGPSLYIQRFGHPRLRARHLPFAIGTRERDLWIACMTRAMEETGVAANLRTALLRALFDTADFMRNRDG